VATFAALCFTQASHTHTHTKLDAKLLSARPTTLSGHQQTPDGSGWPAGLELAPLPLALLFSLQAASLSSPLRLFARVSRANSLPPKRTQTGQFDLLARSLASLLDGWLAAGPSGWQACWLVSSLAGRLAGRLLGRGRRKESNKFLARAQLHISDMRRPSDGTRRRGRPAALASGRMLGPWRLPNTLGLAAH